MELESRSPNPSVIELYFLMEKIKEYEPGIYDNIKNRIGIPKMSVGSLFRFSEQYSDSTFQVIKVIKVSPIEAIYRTPEQIKNNITIYKYGYCMKDYNGIQMLNFIYDSYLDAGYIKIIKL